MDLKGFIHRAILLNSVMAAILAGNRWGASGLLLRKSTGFADNRTPRYTVASQWTRTYSEARAYMSMEMNTDQSVSLKFSPNKFTTGWKIILFNTSVNDKLHSNLFLYSMSFAFKHLVVCDILLNFYLFFRSTLRLDIVRYLLYQSVSLVNNKCEKKLY